MKWLFKTLCKNQQLKSNIRSAFNKFPDFLVQAFKIVIDSWKFSTLLLYILWDDWPIFMISGSNEQLQQQLEYTLLKWHKKFKEAGIFWGMMRGVGGSKEVSPPELIGQRVRIRIAMLRF